MCSHCEGVFCADCAGAGVDSGSGVEEAGVAATALDAVPAAAGTISPTVQMNVEAAHNGGAAAAAVMTALLAFCLHVSTAQQPQHSDPAWIQKWPFFPFTTKNGSLAM